MAASSMAVIVAVNTMNIDTLPNWALESLKTGL